jgi:hypothetical protein
MAMIQIDNSAVFHRDMLDAEFASAFDHPWIFETDESVSTFDTEDEACAAQRDYRKRLGCDPMTGCIEVEHNQ